MAYKNIRAKILTDTGLRENGYFDHPELISTSGGTYTGSWAAFRTHFGLRGWFFDMSWTAELADGTHTQRANLKSGNYAIETVIFLTSGQYLNYDYRIQLYDSNNNLLINMTASGYTLKTARFDHFWYVVGYDDNTNTLRYVRCQHKTNDSVVDYYYSTTSISYSVFIGWLLGSIAPDDPYGLQENDTPTGGYGDFDYTSENETPPALPSLSAANAGFVTLWNPSIGEVGSLADYLWGPTFSVATWQKLWNDPMECLLSLGIVPVAPTTGTRANIYFGNANTGIESAPITTQFVIADMGSMRIDGQSASYMDYAPYAKASIYLPYCGTYALDVDEIMDADLALEYHIDIYTGACVAYLTINNRTNSDGHTVHNVMYQFTGNCLASIPVTSGDHSQLLQSLLFMGASIAATVATAGAGAASGGAIEGLAAEGDVVASSGVLGAATAGSAINTVMSMKPNVMHSGNLSSTAGLLGGQKPFVTFTWSNLCRPDDEYQLVGMPIQKSGTLSDFEGFTIVSACHMDNILCTDAERSMIEQALGRGVII